MTSKVEDRRGRAARRPAERARHPADEPPRSRSSTGMIAAGLRRIEVASFVEPAARAADGRCRNRCSPASSARPGRPLHRARAESQRLRARGSRGLQRDRHGRGRERHVQSPQPGRQHRRVGRRLARYRGAERAGWRPRTSDDLRRVRLPVRGRGCRSQRVIDIVRELRRQSRSRSRSPTRSASACRRRSPSSSGACAGSAR